jgi:tripartite-type tricarboxylate transporter receptor subunit TctC
MTHVPQAGDAETVTAVLGGHLSAAIAAPGSAFAQLKAGKLKVLGAFSEKRGPMYPDLPTFKEMGYDITLGAFHSVIAPKGTPDAIVQILDAAFKKVWESDAFKKYASNTSLTLIYQGPADLKKRIDAELVISADMVKKLNLKTK